MSTFEEFEMPLSIISKNVFGLTFSLTYPSSKNSEILQCSDFNFVCQFKLFPLKSNSISSNPIGKLDLSTSTYSIDHLDQNLSSISIKFDPKTPDVSDDIDHIQKPINIISLDHHVICSVKYGAVTFLPHKCNNIEEEVFSGQEFIFIIDCSYSMNRNEIELASQCLIFFLKSLPENCYFNIAPFSSEYEPFFEKPVTYSQENVKVGIELA